MPVPSLDPRRPGCRSDGGRVDRQSSCVRGRQIPASPRDPSRGGPGMTLADWWQVGARALEVLLLVFVATGAVPVLAAAYSFLAIPVHAFRNHYSKAGPYLPRVAIVVPAWNEGAVIGESIDRLMSLEYPPESLRVFVVDDASTDNT